MIKPFLDTVLIKLTSSCNLNCSYCYVFNGEDISFKELPNVMSLNTLNSVVKSLKIQSETQLEGFAIVLHGGEPLLLGYSKMEYFLTMLRKSLPEKIKYPISIQTNGTLINQQYIDLFLKTGTSVSVSLDGMQSVNDIARLDHKNNTSFFKVLDGISLLNKHDDLLSGTLSVIHPNTSPKEIYNFFKSLNVTSSNFLLQDGNFNKLPIGKRNFESTEYGSWIKEMIEIYLSDNNPTFVIPFIDDLIRVGLGNKSYKEGIGNNRYSILIIETDGEMRKNDTLRSSYNGADFLINRPNIQDTLIESVINSQDFLESSNLQTLVCDDCLKCEYLNICGGGMPLYRWSSEKKYNNPSIYCNDHKKYIEFLKEILK